MAARRIAVGVAVMLSTAALAGCREPDPEEVAARGADEVGRHGDSRWARLDVAGVSEIEYRVAPAFMDESGQPVGAEREYGTTFAQRLVPAGQGDPMLMLRDDVLANGGLLVERGCSVDDPTKRFWSFVVESDGDVVSLRLTEVDGGVLYLASLPSGETEGSFRDTLDAARAGGPVLALPPDPVCPPVDPTLPPPPTVAAG